MLDVLFNSWAHLLGSSPSVIGAVERSGVRRHQRSVPVRTFRDYFSGQISMSWDILGRHINDKAGKQRHYSSQLME